MVVKKLMQALIKYNVSPSSGLTGAMGPRCFVAGGDWLLVKLVKPKLGPDNHTSFLLHMVEDSCLTGGLWLHETLQKHHHQGNGGVS